MVKCARPACHHCTVIARCCCDYCYHHNVFFVLILPFLQVRHPHMTMWADSHRHGLRCHASIPLTPPLPPNLNVTATTQPQHHRYHPTSTLPQPPNLNITATTQPQHHRNHPTSTSPQPSNLNVTATTQYFRHSQSCLQPLHSILSRYFQPNPPPSRPPCPRPKQATNGANGQAACQRRQLQPLRPTPFTSSPCSSSSWT
jgi:hypothetical protein